MTPTLQATAEDRRHRELGEFLRRRRSRLEPTAVGLPARSRRRTPGLRREDVAERAGVSVAWYTSLEQGRPVRPSRRVVEALAAALLLSDVDRDYLFTLTEHTPPTAPRDPSAEAALLQRLVESIEAPAYCTDTLTDVVAYNARAAEVFGDYDRWPDQRRNLLRLLFEQPEFAHALVDRDEYSARVVSSFRGRSDAHLINPDAIEMVDRLRATSERFRELWETQEVRRTASDTLRIKRSGGSQTLTLINLQDVTGTGTRVNVYLPST